ncbi:MAG: hypothetical protein SV760_00270 [Halobacteria archaeon]|nr:hypothetical protein [Halobacteria archaeon]
MTKVQLQSGRHRRPDGDGGTEVFEAGDVFEATEDELDAFGDRLEEVEQTENGWEPTRSEPGVEEAEAGTYRLVFGTHRTTDDDGNEVVLEEGDETYLTEDEVEAFGDKFERVETDDDASSDDSGTDDETSTETASDDETGESPDTAATEGGETESSTSEPEGEDVETGPRLEVPDADVELPEGFPDDVPDAESWDWDALQEVSKANGVDASQAKTDQVADLRSLEGGSQ